MSCPYQNSLRIQYNYNTNDIILKRCCLSEEFKIIKSYDEMINILKNNNFEEVISTMALFSNNECQNCSLKGQILPKITSIEVDIEKTCNLRCYHCFAPDHKKSLLSYNLYFKILETIKKIPLENISFTAHGEPFFYYTKIVDYLSELSNKNTKQVSFTTNLTLLNEPRIKKLKELSDTTQIEYFFVCSIDGITKETYENTRIGGNFEQVIDNLKILKKYFKNIWVSYTRKTPNLSDSEENIYKFYQELNLPVRIYYDIMDN